MARLEAAQRLAQLLQVERALPGPLRHAEPAAQVEHPDVREALGGRGQERARSRPAPGVRMPLPAWACSPTTRTPSRRAQLAQLVELLRGDAELGLRPGRAHVGVVAPPPPRIEPQEDLPAARTPRASARSGCRLSSVTQAPSSKAAPVLLARREVRREEQARAVEVRERRAARGPARPPRRTRSRAPPRAKRASTSGMAVRLDRVEDAVDGVEASARTARPGRRRRRVVDVDRLALGAPGPAAPRAARATTPAAPARLVRLPPPRTAPPRWGRTPALSVWCRTGGRGAAAPAARSAPRRPRRSG